MQALYDEDVLEEEVILKWFEGSCGSMVNEEQGSAARKHTEPFIVWLKEAEAEDDDDDE